MARASSVVILVVAILFGPQLKRDVRPVYIILAAAILLVLAQLVPLPAGFWQALPGRSVFGEAARASGQPQPWRPLAIVPGGALNSAASMIVPLTVLLLAGSISDKERGWLPGLLLVVIVPALLAGLLQFAGSEVTNPLINSQREIIDNAQRVMVDGPFANRNHFALFLAMGCVAAPAWAFSRGTGAMSVQERPARWRAPVALGLMILFLLAILASGSRAGLLLGVLGITAGLLLACRPGLDVLRRYPRLMVPVAITAIIATFGLVVLISVVAGRASSIERILTSDATQDFRARSLPIVLTMVREYFPAGSGFGSFDPLFRIHEPLSLLQLEYLNHAHDDFVEVVLEGGLPALLLLLGALAWWASASFRAWRSRLGEQTIPRMGSAILLLVLVASVVDYPARTPMIMAFIIVAASCLCFRVPETSALRRSDPRL